MIRCRVFCVVVATCLLLTVSPAAGDRPNLVLILADDMGYSDLGCYGGEIETPHLDRMAANGLRFTQFYNTARCVPARASLLTGLYLHQTGLGHMVYNDRGPEFPGYRTALNRHCVTFVEVLREAGYQTRMTGKWHAGHDEGSRPSDRGFDRFIGMHSHVDSYFIVRDRHPGERLFKNNDLLLDGTTDPPNHLNPDEEWYTTRVYTDWAIEFVDEAVENDAPFVLYVAHNAPHWPLEALDEDIEKYRGKYRDGWEPIRQARYERMREMGLLDERWTLPPSDAPQWDRLSEDDRDNLDFRRTIYAAQIDRLDQEIGRLVERLQEHDVADNTLILFLSDNGCAAEPEGRPFGYQFRNNRVDNFDEWRAESGRSSSQGRAWANASNTPFRLYKKSTHEGGIATPLIAYWPAGIAETQRGQLYREPGHLVDIMATFVDVTGADYPERFAGHDIRPMEGVSLRPAFAGHSLERGRPLFWEHQSNWAIRDGRWKLVADGAGAELYDMEADRTEMRNLADRDPQRVRELTETWHAWARRRNVLPWPWEPAFSLERP